MHRHLENLSDVIRSGASPAFFNLILIESAEGITDQNNVSVGFFITRDQDLAGHTGTGNAVFHGILNQRLHAERRKLEILCADLILNGELIALLNRRAVFAAEIGKIKKAKGLPVFDAGREESVLARVAEMAESAGGPLSPESVSNIFRSIMEETRKVEE